MKAPVCVIRLPLFGLQAASIYIIYANKYQQIICAPVSVRVSAEHNEACNEGTLLKLFVIFTSLSECPESTAPHLEGVTANHLVV